MTQIVKTEIVVAVIGAVGVTGTIVGTVVGALFQANGGHAQAAAARAAANTAARAAWHQTMRDLRWTVLSAYLRAAAEADEADEAAHRTGAPADVEAARKSFHAYRLAYAEAELIASDAVLPALTTLNERLQASHLQALQRALATAAIRELEDRRRLGNSAASHSLLRLEEGMDQGLAQMEMVDLGRDVLRLLPETSERLYRISIILSFPRTYDEIINYTSAAEARSDLLAIDRTRLVNVIRTELGTTA
ncbi:hypothetical protein ACFYYM_07970 [Streptomyces erythrochromogenes]|uniref:hypothetical protein n=1 Tax=Streptomyces erythrochromogenes TaxID=285574 RepID=UPI0036CCDF05